MQTDLDPGALVGRVLRFAEAEELFQPGMVVAAVSGGQDSVCMLDILRRLREPLGIDLHVAHLNHMFRGAQAESEAEFVRRLAEGWGLPVTVAAIDVPAFRARRRLTREVAARYARYQFLAAVAAQVGSDQVALGHTGDDLVETLLMNLMRGTGLRGLRGILPRREMTPGQLGLHLEAQEWRTPQLRLPERSLPFLVRPILMLSRAETEGYCRSRGLDFRTDLSNVDVTYRRNWVRGELLPLLERHAPGVRERLRDTAALLAEDYAVVSAAVEDAWSGLARAAGGRVEFPLDRWPELSMAVQRELLRRAVEELAGSLEDLGRVHVEAAEALIRQGAVGARVDLPAGISLEKGYDSFWLYRRGGRPRVAPPRAEKPVRLPVPGSASLAEGVVEAQLLEPKGPEEGGRERCGGGRWEACLDADTAGTTLLLRHRRPGDRFVPLGMEHPKKLHDFFVDEKVPRAERDRVALVATPDQVVWVVGYRIDGRFKVRPDTRRVLRLSFRPEVGRYGTDQGTQDENG